MRTTKQPNKVRPSAIWYVHHKEEKNTKRKSDFKINPAIREQELKKMAIYKENHLEEIKEYQKLYQAARRKRKKEEKNLQPSYIYDEQKSIYLNWEIKPQYIF
jgi:hypothetical protein